MSKENEIVETEIPTITPEQVQQMIHVVRGERVILDRDLARLYQVETKILNKQVKRNIERFPSDFMFQLTWAEMETIRRQNDVIETADNEGVNSLWFQNGTLNSGRGQHSKYLPYAFTEEGVAMLSGLLRSPIAIQVNIQIMRAFVYMKNTLMTLSQTSLRQDKLELAVENLSNYVENLLHDQNDTNEDISAQLDAFNSSLADLTVRVKQLESKPNSATRPIGYDAIQNGYKK